MKHTRFTNIEVTGDLKAEGLSLTDDTIEKVTTADATDAATAITLVNDLKAKYNALVEALT